MPSCCGFIRIIAAFGIDILWAGLLAAGGVEIGVAEGAGGVASGDRVAKLGSMVWAEEDSDGGAAGELSGFSGTLADSAGTTGLLAASSLWWDDASIARRTGELTPRLINSTRASSETSKSVFDTSITLTKVSSSKWLWTIVILFLLRGRCGKKN
jgi:hypothetical protein